MGGFDRRIARGRRGRLAGGGPVYKSQITEKTNSWRGHGGVMEDNEGNAFRYQLAELGYPTLNGRTAPAPRTAFSGGFHIRIRISATQNYKYEILSKIHSNKLNVTW